MIPQLSVFQYGFISLLLVAFYYSLSFLTVIFYSAAVFLGGYALPKLLTPDRLRIFQEAVIFALRLSPSAKAVPSPLPKPPPTKPGARRHRSISSSSAGGPIHTGPSWETLKVSARVNEAAEELVLLIIDNYINKWYKAEISADNAFVGEIQYQIRYAASLVLKESKQFDFGRCLLEELLPVIIIHLDRVAQKLRSSTDIPPPVVEVQILEQMNDLHIAMTSRANELDYLRIMADCLVERLVDDSRVGGRADDYELPVSGFNKSRPWPSHCVRHFLRELTLSSVLIPILDFISNPDTLNCLLLAALEPSSGIVVPKIDTKQVESRFLAKLTEATHNDVPDSLLALKLSDIVREPKLLQLFYMYLRDIRGPAHFVDAFLQARDLHNDILKVEGSGRDFFEVESDAWQFFSDFVHESAPHRVHFENEQIADDLRHAINVKDHALMKRVTEDVYKEMYHRLNFPYVVPFCQSECYLGHLCGAPPSVVELIRGPQETAKAAKKPPAESSFSLSQFRNRFFSAFTGSSGSQANETTTFSLDDEPEVDELEDERLEAGGDALIDMGRDLNKWIVTVPRVEPRKDAGGRIFYVYVLQVERLDVPVTSEGSTSSSETFGDTLPSTWAITRKYDEFHILESKLREFHGTSIRVGVLPDKRLFHPKNRTFMDAQRMQFERFVQALLLQPALRKSEMVYAFLTNEEEIREDQPFVSDLNPFRVMRKVPSKLQRERGQNLKPYLLNVLANILAPTNYYAEAPSAGKEANSDVSSLRSFSSDNDIQFSSKIALDNLQLTQKHASDAISTTPPEQPPDWLRLPSRVLVFFLVRVAGFASDFFLATLLLIQCFSDRIFDAIARRQIRLAVKQVAEEETILAVIHSLQNIVVNGSVEASDDEKKLRVELTQRRLDEFLEDRVPAALSGVVDNKDLRRVSADLVRAAQFPRLNKQLAFVLLDAIVDKVRAKPVFEFPIVQQPSQET